jgi:hypothetical protein
MKKIFLVVLLSIVCSLSFSQAITNRGTSSVTVSDARLQAQYNLFIPRYADTTAANLQKGIDSCGAIIYTYSGNKIWKRGCSPKRWIEVGATASIPDLQQVTDAGNTTTNAIIVNDAAAIFEDGTIGAAVYRVYESGGQVGVDDPRFNIQVNDLDTSIAGYNKTLQLPLISGTIALKEQTIDSLKRSTDSIFARKGDNWVFQYKDSIGGGGGGSGTVTSIIAGYGLDGDTITTSGTISVDTATLSAKYVRVADTSSMLSGYIRAYDTLNYIPKWVGSKLLSKSQMFDDGTSVGIGTASPNSAYLLDVRGIISTPNGVNLNSTLGVKTGLYSGSNSFSIWAGNSQMASYGLVGNSPGSYFTHDLGFVNAFSSTGTQNAWRISASVIPSGANSMIHNQILIDPQYAHSTLGTGTVRGIYYNPTVTSLNGAPHFAWESTSGDVRFGNLAGSGTRMVTADATGTLGTQSIPTGTVTSITASSPLTGGTITSTGTIGITQATTSVDGYLSSTDFTTLSNNWLLKAYQDLGSTFKCYTLSAPQGISGITASLSLSDNSARFIVVYVPTATTITGVKWYQVTQGVYTADQTNQIGLYSISAGSMTLVASSANNGNLWKGTSQTWVNEAFSSPYSASAGVYVIGMVYNSSAQTTAPAIGAATALQSAVAGTNDFANSVKINGNLVTQNSLPASTAMSSISTATSQPLLWLY